VVGLSGPSGGAYSAPQGRLAGLWDGPGKGEGRGDAVLEEWDGTEGCGGKLGRDCAVLKIPFKSLDPGPSLTLRQIDASGRKTELNAQWLSKVIQGHVFWSQWLSYIFVKVPTM